METLNITPERFQQALAWMNGQASTLGEQEVLQMLRSLTGRFQENCKALRPGPVARFRNLRLTPHPLSLTATSGYPLMQSKAQLILYCLYGARLGAGLDRLPIEHPQMWKYGPVFPRAFKKSSIEDRAACEESYLALLEGEPVLMGALTAKTEAMMSTPMADLNAVHKSAQSPYGKTKARFPEKWGVQIPDEDIAEFFRMKKDG